MRVSQTGSPRAIFPWLDSRIIHPYLRVIPCRLLRGFLFRSRTIVDHRSSYPVAQVSGARRYEADVYDGRPGYLINRKFQNKRVVVAWIE